MDSLNFSYALICVVGVLAAISIILIFVGPAPVTHTVSITPGFSTPCRDTGECYLRHENLPPGKIVHVPGCQDADECFVPREITIHAGSSVVWTNHDTSAHSVLSGKFNDSKVGVLFDSGFLLTDSSFELTFADAGRYDYFCVIFPWMDGSVNVI